MIHRVSCHGFYACGQRGTNKSTLSVRNFLTPGLYDRHAPIETHLLLLAATTTSSVEFRCAKFKSPSPSCMMMVIHGDAAVALNYSPPPVWVELLPRAVAPPGKKSSKFKRRPTDLRDLYWPSQSTGLTEDDDDPHRDGIHSTCLLVVGLTKSAEWLKCVGLGWNKGGNLITRDFEGQ